MESREATRGGILEQGGIGHAIRSLSVSEQFHTRSCARCAGLLVNDWCYDLDNTGEYNAEVLRCVQCGNRVDPVIVQNHTQQPVAKDHMRRVQPMRSAGMELPTKAA